MNSIVDVVFFAVIAAASAGIVAPSGFIARSYAPALSAYSSPLLYNAPLAYNTPLAYKTPLTYNTLLAYNAYSARIPALGQTAESTVVAGPSGTITNTKSIATPTIAAGYGLPSTFSYSGLYL